MTKTETQDYAFVYKKAYAMRLIEQGHQVFTTMPNPQNSRMIMWVFRIDETFYSDLEALVGGGSRVD